MHREKINDAVAIVNQAVAEGVYPQTIIDRHLMVGMEEIGKKFEEGKAFVPNLLLAARAMKGCLPAPLL